jgi:PAS domain S-box-containing protein
MKDKNKTKDQLINELAKLRQRIVKLEKSKTELKQADEALRESERRYRDIVEKAGIGILIDDEWGNVKYANKKAAELYGYSLEEMNDQSVKSLVHPDDFERVTKFHKARIQGKRVPSSYVFKGVRKDGAVRYFELTVAPDKKEESIIGTRLYLKDVTEQKRAEEALREKEAFNFALFQHNPIETIVVDREGKVVKINRSRRKSGDRIPNIGDVMYKDYAGKHEIDMRAKLMECIRSGKIKRFPGLKYDDKFLSISIAPFPMGAIITSQDITKSKRAEEALQEERDKAQKYLDIAGVILIAINRDGNVTLINKKGCEILGYDEREIVGMNWFDNFIPERLRDIIKPVSKKLLAGKLEPAKYFENPVLTRKGEERLIAWYNTILRDEKGTIIGHLSSGEDITERKQMEKILRDSEERFRQFFENAPDYCYMVSLQGKILNINAAALAMLGYKKKDIIGKPFQTTIYAPSSVEKARKLFIQWKNTGKLRNEELNIITKAGEERTVLLNVDAVRSDDRKVLYSISVQTDITERKRAEEQMKASLKEKEVLLQEIHHRVKNNMQIISSILNLQSGVIKNKRVLELFKSSQSRIKSMALIHEKLYKSKDFTRIDFSKYVQSLSNDLFRVYGINQDVVKLHIDIKDVLLDINTAIPCGLIINELISNSLKYAFPDGRKGKIKIAMFSLNNNEMELTVSDNGVGIPEEMDIRGTKSLGLHLVTILAEDQLQGEIKLDKTKGTKFHMILRIKK